MEPLLPEQPPYWLLKKYRDGLCSAEETTIIDAWFETGAHLADSPTEDQDIADIRVHVMAVVRSGKRSRLRFISRLSAAAAACLLVIAGAWYMMRFRTVKTPPASMVTIRTDAGQQKKITLPDGSSVLLNSSSELQYPPSFMSSRRVYLQGEAFFDVKPGADKAFSVVTDSLQVLVLGTRFNMAGYAGNVAQQVTLESGKVAVYKAADKNRTGENAVLHPGEMLQYAHEELLVKPADMEAALAWQHGLLIYRNTPLAEICRDLERRYGVTIHISNDQMGSRLYHYRSRQIPLASVLKVLSETGKGFHYSIYQKNIVIN